MRTSTPRQGMIAEMPRPRLRPSTSYTHPTPASGKIRGTIEDSTQLRRLLSIEVASPSFKRPSLLGPADRFLLFNPTYLALGHKPTLSADNPQHLRVHDTLAKTTQETLLGFSRPYIDTNNFHLSIEPCNPD